MNLKFENQAVVHIRRLSWAAGLSLGLHLSILVALIGLAHLKPKTHTLEVVPFSAQDLLALKEKIAAENKVKEEAIKKIKIKRDTRHQIVNTDQNGLNQVPQDNYFLGKSNQTFARQTAARRNGS